MFKTFYGDDHQRLDAHHAWNMEAKNLRELNAQNHEHLIRRIATIAHGRKYLILSDWADGGDLKTFWDQNPRPVVSPKLVMEVIVQLHGLASAIQLMHHGHYSGTLSRRASHRWSTTPPSIPHVTGPDLSGDQLADVVPALEDSNWRHGDLKPENILRFLATDEMVGTLRISDLGLAKRHTVATGLRRLPSTARFGTAAYEPPEAVTRLGSPRSRLYDIWSFGCIMLEFVIWLVYG